MVTGYDPTRGGPARSVSGALVEKLCLNNSAGFSGWMRLGKLQRICSGWVVAMSLEDIVLCTVMNDPSRFENPTIHCYSFPADR